MEEAEVEEAEVEKVVIEKTSSAEDAGADSSTGMNGDGTVSATAIKSKNEL